MFPHLSTTTIHTPPFPLPATTNPPNQCSCTLTAGPTPAPTAYTSSISYLAAEGKKWLTLATVHPFLGRCMTGPTSSSTLLCASPNNRESLHA